MQSALLPLVLNNASQPVIHDMERRFRDLQKTFVEQKEKEICLRGPEHVDAC